MAKDPAFLFYSQDFITGTLAMPFDERGKYITLLCYQHQSGRMSEETIRFLVGSFSDMLKCKFKQDEDGFFYNERLELEAEKRNKFIESRVNNGKLGGRPKEEIKPNDKPLGYPKNNLGENEDVNEIKVKNINIEFETFWNLYEKKVGDKEKIEKKWNNLTNEDRIRIMEYVPKYKLSEPNKKYRKNPDTFFNQKAWNDEIIGDNKTFAPMDKNMKLW